MTSKELSLLKQLVVNWEEPARKLPEGPVDLWVALISTERRVLGASPLPDGGRMGWRMKNGNLEGTIRSFTIEIWESGKIADTLLLAVAGGRYAIIDNTGRNMKYSDKNVVPGSIITMEDFNFTFEG